MKIIKNLILLIVLLTVQTKATEGSFIQGLSPVTQNWRSASPFEIMMSCRFYKKRFESFLQRATEFHWAVMNEKRKLTYEESLRLKDLAERRNVPLRLNTEDLVWEGVFELPSTINPADLQKADWMVEVDSSQLRLSGAGLPALDEFSILPFGQYLTIRIRMDYWNACLLKNYLKIDFKNTSGEVIKINLNLIESF